MEYDPVDLPYMPGSGVVGPHGLLESVGAGAEVIFTFGELGPSQGVQIQLLLQIRVPPFFQPSGGHGGLLVDIPGVEAPLLEPIRFRGGPCPHTISVEGVGDPFGYRGAPCFQFDCLWIHCRRVRCRGFDHGSAHRPFHFQVDEAVQFHRVLQGKFLGDGFDEPTDDKGHSLLFRHPPTL